MSKMQCYKYPEHFTVEDRSKLSPHIIPPSFAIPANNQSPVVKTKLNLKVCKKGFTVLGLSAFFHIEVKPRSSSVSVDDSLQSFPVGATICSQGPFLFGAAQLPYRIYFKHCQDAFDAMSFLTLAHRVCSVLQSFTSLLQLFLPCDNFKETKLFLG